MPTGCRDYTPLLSLLGLLFQIRDDYGNLCSSEYEANKSFCEDITEGKFSFPLIHSILRFGLSTKPAVTPG